MTEIRTPIALLRGDSSESDYRDILYFMQRAGEERIRAQGCVDNAVAMIHLAMALEYERRVYALTQGCQPFGEEQIRISPGEHLPPRCEAGTPRPDAGLRLQVRSER